MTKRLGIALACAAALAFPAAYPAAADPGGPTTSGLRRTFDLGERQLSSDMYAGYVAPLHRRKRVSGTFQVPQLSCAGKPDSGIMSIIEIASVDGKKYADGAVFSYCQDGVGYQLPVFDASSGQLPIPEVVEDGDLIQVISRTERHGLIDVNMINRTQHWDAEATFEGIPASAASSLQYRFDLGGEPLPPYDYGSLPVKEMHVGGKNIRKSHPTRVDMVIEGAIVISPGDIGRRANFRYRYVG